MASTMLVGDFGVGFRGKKMVVGAVFDFCFFI